MIQKRPDGKNVAVFCVEIEFVAPELRFSAQEIQQKTKAN